MTDYQIISDSACDLPADMLEKLNVRTVPLTVLFRGENREDCVDDSAKVMYDGLRAGETATTAAVNPDRWMGVIEPVLAAGQQLMEVKFDEYLPAFIKENLETGKLQQTSFSKYYLCRKYSVPCAGGRKR